jgi:hypothetical protein
MIEIKIDLEKFQELSEIVCSEENIGHLVHALVESSHAEKDERIKWVFNTKPHIITVRKRTVFNAAG